ncbi:MAG: glycosyltransferase family 39 protein [Phycisphaerae bacterium]
MLRLMGRRPAIELLMVSVLVHVCVLLAAYLRTGGLGGYAFASLDCGEFYTIARNLAEHTVFSQSEVPPLRPDTWRTPGYPLFLAMFLSAFGDSPAMLVVVQQVLAVVNVLLLFRIAALWMSERRAMVVAALFLVEPYHLYYSLWLMSTTLFVTVLLLAWYVWCRALGTCPNSPEPRASACADLRTTSDSDRIGRSLTVAVRNTRADLRTTSDSDRIGRSLTVAVRNTSADLRTTSDSDGPLVGHRWGWCTLLGVLAGLLVLVRPVASLIPIALLAGLFVTYQSAPRQTRDHGTRRSWLSLPVFAVCCVVVVGLWMTRNRVVAGHFALSDQGGVVLAYFKATEVELWRQERTADRYLETTLDPAKAEQPHTVWEDIDARLRDEFASLPENQRATLRWQNLAQGNKTTVDSFAVSDALNEIGWSYITASPLSTAACCLVRCGSALTFPLNLAMKPPRGVEASRLAWLVKGSIYLALSVWVLVRILRGGLGFAPLYFPLACTIALLLATTPQLDPRFRVPMVPLLLFTALLSKPTS